MTAMKLSRPARGLQAHLCSQCKVGVGVGDVLTFAADCDGCQRKLASGKRTGNEPAPDHARARKAFKARLHAEKSAVIAKWGE